MSVISCLQALVSQLSLYKDYEKPVAHELRIFTDIFRIMDPLCVGHCRTILQNFAITAIAGGLPAGSKCVCVHGANEDHVISILYKNNTAIAHNASTINIITTTTARGTSYQLVQ